MQHFFTTVSIFILYNIHAVGIDLRQKLLLMKENNISLNHKQRNKQTSTFLPMEDVCVIDDDETTSGVSAKELRNSANSKRENDSM